MIAPDFVGIESKRFNISVSELRALYEKRAELATIYTPNSEPMREIDRLIKEAKGSSNRN